MPGFRTPDAVVVGGGATGLVVAHELTARGFGVLILEPGIRHDQSIFGADVPELLHQDGLLRWGPIGLDQPSWPRELEGIAFAPQVPAVGGLDVVGWNVRPRATPRSVEHGWPLRYSELVPWYERIEELTPVRVPERLAPKDQRFIDACVSLRLAHLEGADADRVGWKIQPLAALSAAESFADRASATGMLEIRNQTFAVELLHEATADGLRRVRGVVYRAADGSLVEQDADTIVLCAGAIETPRLVLASALGAPGVAGRGLTCHLPDLISGILPEPIHLDAEPASLARCEFPGYGSIFPIRLDPLSFAIASSLGDPATTASGPWNWSGWSTGSTLKRRIEAWPRTLTLGMSIDDRSRAGNGVRLSETQDEHGAVPRVRYDPDDDSIRRREWLARRAGEILLAAGADPGSIHRADAPTALLHAMSTMRMGADPDLFAVDLDGRLHRATNAFVADTSIFPNAIGGADPILTAQAMAARIAAGLARRLS
jgi:choline dehydrogenase-like flavoprotein